MLPLPLKERYRLGVSENRVLRKKYVPKRKEIVGGWRQLQKVGLHNLCASENII
jgi:hypothetical protein